MNRVRRIAVLIAFVVSSVRAADPATDVEPVDEAVRRGLAYLARMQQADGCWLMPGFGTTRSPGVTGLCTMAFLSAGHTPTAGRYAPVVSAGLKWVIGQQNERGLIAAGDQFDMYHHGICTLLLAEATGMCDPDLGRAVRQALVKAVGVILRAQRFDGAHRGGWRYSATGSDGDLSVTGWQLLALRAARNVGCDVPVEAIDRAVAYVRACYDDRGQFAYMPRSYLTIPCTGVGILCLELAGKKLHRAAPSLRGAASILQNPPKLDQQHCYYGLYYCSQAMFQLGDNHWTTYRDVLHKLLLRNQQENGSWTGRDVEASRAGPNYTTAMGILALTVEYRFLPIYQRGDDAEKGK